jgi:hypothetical protein
MTGMIAVRVRRMRLRTLMAATVAAGALVAPTGALASNGITPLAPKSGATVPAGKSPTFKFRATGSGSYWVVVCKSKKKDKFGVICDTASATPESLGQAKKKGSSYSFKPKFFDFPEFWLNSPGKYYWQVYRIPPACGSDCKQESAIVTIKVG